MAVAAAAGSAGAIGAEFRIHRLAEGTIAYAESRYTNASAIKDWTDDEAMPGAVEHSSWELDLKRTGTRRRVAAAVRSILSDAGRQGLLGREQVVDLLAILEQAFDRVGPASRRLPG